MEWHDSGTQVGNEARAATRTRRSPQKECSAAALVARAQAGDAGALAALVRQYESLIRGRSQWLCRRFRCPDGADERGLNEEDVYQEAYAMFLELVYEYNPARGAPFGAYVNTMLRWRLRNFVRRQHRIDRQLVSLDGTDVDSLATAATPATLVEDVEAANILAAVDTRTCVAAALEALPVYQRVLLIQRYVHERSLRDLAHALGISLRAVCTLERQALAEVRGRLADCRAGVCRQPACKAACPAALHRQPASDARGEEAAHPHVPYNDHSDDPGGVSEQERGCVATSPAETRPGPQRIPART